MDKLRLRTKAKEIVAKFTRDSARLRYLTYLGRFENWRKSRVEKFPTFENRYRLYDYLNERIIGNEEISYLEFGVSKGESLKYWTEINTDPSSRFWGFDTFFGLPESWEVFTQTVEKNMFSMDGNPPAIDDERNSFVKGKFQETLPGFLREFKSDRRLVIHHDADLYTSTLYALCQLDAIAKPGTILIFDEFTSVLHEFRAFEDYCSSFLRDYVVLGATDGPHDYFSQIAVEMK